MTSNDNKRNNKHKMTIIGLVALIIILLILLLLRSCGTADVDAPVGGGKKFDTATDANAQNGERVKKSKEELEAELNQKVKDGMINMIMNPMPTFEDGKSKGTLLIENSKSNKYPQVIEIYIKDTEELIYTSKLIPVGSRIDSAKLDVPLAKGEYKCIAYFNAVNEETGESLGKGGAEITVVVQN